MLKGNKGEWSEIYTLLKVISDKQLFAGDSNLDKIKSLIFPVVKILRDESGGTFEFFYDSDLVIITDGKEEFRVPVIDFKKQADVLLQKLQSKTDRTFSVPEIESFTSKFKITSLKAKSTVKSDIRIVIHDHRTGTNPELGFSIKSRLGGASTLLNAGKTTNFIYRISNLNLTQNQISKINSIETRSKIKDRLEIILMTLGGQLQFEQNESATFESNLILIDSALPRIVSEILLLYFTSGHSKISDLVNIITENNPLGYNVAKEHPFYSYKIKRLLTDIALGMVPATVWTGELDATGGYLVVKEDGDVLCYHIYNRNEFEDYLYYNTRLETASSSRHDFGFLYEDSGQLYFKLNLQIRFL